MRPEHKSKEICWRKTKRKNNVPKNYEQRDQKLRKRRNSDMVVSNRSIFVMDQAASKRNAREEAKYQAKRRKEKYG